MAEEAGMDPQSVADKTTNPDEICFLVGRPRSGTTVFRSMLESHPQVFGLGEIFNEDNPKSYFNFLRKRQAKNPNALLPSKAVENFLAYVRWCRRLSLDRRPASRLIVIDVKYDQAHLLCVPWWGITFLPRLFSLIREQEWRVIDIHRRDLVGMFVSNHVAIQTGVYHSTNPAHGTQEPAKVHVDPDALMRHIASTANAYRRVSEHFYGFDRYLCVAYEEMFEGTDDGSFRPALLDRLSGFLGIENAFERSPKLSRVLAKDPLSYVANAAQIRDVLRRSGGAVKS
jgi:hypothetical protein